MIKDKDDDIERLFDNGPDLLETAIASKPHKRQVFIGCPMKWFSQIFAAAKGKNDLAIGLHLYRLRAISGNRATINVPNGWLRKELGISRYTKYRALGRFARAGLIRVTRRGHEALRVTFLRSHRRTRRSHRRTGA